jgi:hypothetical protein
MAGACLWRRSVGLKAVPESQLGVSLESHFMTEKTKFGADPNFPKIVCPW